MRRTKEWWAALTKEERSWLVYAERNDKSYRSAYLPDDSSECGVCGQPMMGMGGMCRYCLDRLIGIILKAEEACDEMSNL